MKTKQLQPSRKKAGTRSDAQGSERASSPARAASKKKKNTKKSRAARKKGTPKPKRKESEKVSQGKKKKSTAKKKSAAGKTAKQNRSRTKKIASRKNRASEDKKKKSQNKKHQTTENATEYAFEIAGRDDILAFLAQHGAPVDLESLREHFGYAIDSEQAEALRRRLRAMCRDAQLIRNRAKAYVPVSSSDLVAGFISANAAGYGFVVCDDDQSDVYLHAAQMRQVLHGDKVVVCITGTDHKGRREGRVTDVVERAHKTLVGRLIVEPGVVFVRPENNRIHLDFLVDAQSLGDAQNGDMVVIDIVEQPTRKHPPVGRIISVLGQHLEPGMEIDVALHNHGIPYEWPGAVTKQASRFGDKPGERDKDDRRDVTRLPLVTIDGEDARDFDDAVYCERADDGKGWRLYVAIADVSHYVQPDSPIDSEALLRGTSVYFPEHVVPMLPETLSNGLCSLNPDVERLCMLCVMSLDNEGNLKRSRFQRAVMRSHARLTYTEVAAMIETHDADLRQQHAKLLPHLENLHALYQLLSDKRQQRGCIEFDSKETRFEFDANRKIEAIVPVHRNVAHRMIEECMITANVAAAAFLSKHRVPALYRVHFGPTKDRLEDLRAFLALRGLELGGGDKPTTGDLAEVARQASALPDARIVHTVLLRSMQAAVYQPACDGHFGLALDHYAHFTSPIRRYPDLLVHRAIAHVIDGGSAANYPLSQTTMTQLGESCSMTERRAEEATRDVASWLKCEYMSHRIGETFAGVVASVTSFGLFIQIEELQIDGLAHVSTLGSDYFHFDSAALTLTGERTGTQFRLGDLLTVEVTDVNMAERKIDFELRDVTVGRGKKRRAPAERGGAKRTSRRSKRKHK